MINSYKKNYKKILRKCSSFSLLNAGHFRKKPYLRYYGDLRYGDLIYGCFNAFLKVFGHKTNILKNFKLQIAENIMLFGDTCWINQVSLKNIDIWPGYRPKLPSKYQLIHIIWAYVFWPLLGHFLSKRAENFFGKSGDYYLSTGDAFLEKIIFLGPQVPTKKLAHWVDLLGQPLSLKLVFKKFGYEPPPF